MKTEGLRKDVIVLTALLVVLGTFTAALAEGDALEQAIALHERIERAQHQVEIRDRGHVIVGRVVVEDEDDPAMVNAQMLILKNGMFAGAVKDLERPVGFRMHQYAPYDLHLDGESGELINVGVIRLRRLHRRQLVPVIGRVVLEGSEDASIATVGLTAAKGPINTPSNGTNPRPSWPRPVEVPLGPDGVVEASGFSPITYRCSVKAPGYVSQLFDIDFRPGTGADIGTVTLEKPRRAVLKYMVAENGTFKLSAMQQTAITGGQRWYVDPDDYRFDLKFPQQDGRLQIDYSYAPCYIADLGRTSLRRSLNIDLAAATERPRDLFLQEGHVYLLNQQHLKRYVLFKVRKLE